MFQPRKGRKTRKAQNSDHFRGEWLAHQAAITEEERIVSDDELCEELEGGLDTLRDRGEPRIVVGIIIA